MSKSVYEMLTERIIDQLENNIIPWQKQPWIGIRSGAYNRISKKPYSLLNQMLLKQAGEYATFKQWQNLGGHVRKGEKAEIDIVNIFEVVLVTLIITYGQKAVETFLKKESSVPFGGIILVVT